MKKSDESIKLISYILNGRDKPEVKNWGAVIEKLERHTILSMVLGHLNGLEIPNDITSRIDRYKDRNISNYLQILVAQQKVIDELESRNVRFVVLKGTSAGQYYPRLSDRTYGDIDLLINEEDDFNKAVDVILNLGYSPMYKYVDMKFHQDGYHMEFSMNGIKIELHPCFNKEDNKLAPYIKAGEIKMVTIGEWHFPAFTDLTNGLILLRHMRHHCPFALGMRQVIDWAYYLKSVMTDEFWDTQFGAIAIAIGNKDFAVHITRMCELYFGIEEHKFAAGADERICRNLFDIICANGNFGTRDVITHKTSVLMNAGNKIARVRNRGLFTCVCTVLKKKDGLHSVFSGIKHQRQWTYIKKMM